jgi:hypothetical protein
LVDIHAAVVKKNGSTNALRRATLYSITMHRQRASSTATGHTGRYLKDAEQYTLPQV